MINQHACIHVFFATITKYGIGLFCQLGRTSLSNTLEYYISHPRLDPAVAKGYGGRRLGSSPNRKKIKGLDGRRSRLFPVAKPGMTNYLLLAVHSQVMSALLILCTTTYVHTDAPVRFGLPGADRPRWFALDAHRRPQLHSSSPASHALHASMRSMLREQVRAACTSKQAISKPNIVPEVVYTVRVLLDEIEYGDVAGHEWILESKQGFIVQSGPDRWRLASRAHIRIQRGTVLVNNRRVTHNQCMVTPIDGHTHFKARHYKGTFTIHTDEDGAYVINSLDLEEYICGVLSTESWPGWPLEVNKVLAIAARSYVLAMIMRCKTTKLPYHIRNSNYHQTYGGAHDNPVHRAAVEQTRGLFLAYDDQPIIAMFDGCCGGVIPAHIADSSVAHLPYLARTYACTYCKKCKIYQWHAQYTPQEFLQKIKKEAPKLHTLHSVTIAKKDKAGLVKEVKCKGRGKHHAVLSGRKMYSLLKEVKSFCFTITHRNDSIELHGRGFGHHLGLCQWGAREMVRDKDYKKTLEYYYPGTTLMKLV